MAVRLRRCPTRPLPPSGAGGTPSSRRLRGLHRRRAAGAQRRICEDGSVHAHLAATTSREDFCRLAAGHRVVPVTRKVLADSETPLSAYRTLAADRPVTFVRECGEKGPLLASVR